MRRLKIFTWHVHGSYLYYLSRVPHDFYVPVKSARPFGYAGRTNSYDWPANVIEVPADKVRDLEFDCILFQSHDNWLNDQFEILSEKQRRLPRIFLEHNTPKSSPTETQHPVDDPNVLLVHVTHYNDLAWDSGACPTRVIEHGVVVPEDVRSTYELERGLVVVNNILSRGRRMGGDLFLRAREEVPIDLVGMGWKEADGLGEVPHDELAAFHSRYRFHFSPIRHSSLALSTCEAMMIGQPVVGLATTEMATVIENGVSGYVDTRFDRIVEFMKLLMRDQGLARELGEGARKTALERFHVDRFRQDWTEAFSLVTGSAGPIRRRIPRTQEPKKRVALISEHASPVSRPGSVDSGGQNIYVAHVARNLARQGYDVDVFTRRDDDALPEVMKWENGVRIVHVDAGPPEPIRKEDLYPHIGEFTDTVESFCRWQRDAYDIVHANFWMSGLVACELKKRLSLPFVITFHALGRVRRLHQGAADKFPDTRFAVEDRIVREADHIIAECPQDREDLVRLYDADPSKMTVVPCGFDSREVFPIERRTARRHLGLDPDMPLLLQLGRMVPRKGVDFAIRGFARAVKAYGCKGKLMIVGGDSEVIDPLATPEVGRLMKIAHEEGVTEHVTFIGRRDRDQLKYYYSAADAFLTTPWYEPFGITPLEAMACGTPVIGTRVGGIKFSVIDGETGYLVEPNDVEALSERIGRVLNDQRLRQRLSNNAYERAHRHFRWEKIGLQIGRIYERVVAHHERITSLRFNLDLLATQEGTDLLMN